MKQLLLFVLLFLTVFTGISQNTNTAVTTSTVSKENFIQVSGVIVGDSLMGIPFANVMIKGTKRGTATDYYGFFTIVAQPGDELQFFALTHKSAVYKLDDTLSLKHYFIIQRLIRDTIQLANVDVYPWPSKEEFKQAFLNLDLSQTDYERATKNLNKSSLSYEERNLKMDSQANYRYAMQQYLTKIYTAGQYPTISLLNPVAWAQFIDAWRRGVYKKDSKKKDK
jgi:hypothetical protein